MLFKKRIDEYDERTGYTASEVEKQSAFDADFSAHMVNYERVGQRYIVHDCGGKRIVPWITLHFQIAR